jgi:hypothetical protein
LGVGVGLGSGFGDGFDPVSLGGLGGEGLASELAGAVLSAAGLTITCGLLWRQREHALRYRSYSSEAREGASTRSQPQASM